MRLFIAVPLPENAAAALNNCTKPLREKKNVRLVPKQNLHCTILFIGEKSESECKSIIETIKEIREHLSAAEISVNRLVLFPSGTRKPRVIAAAVDSANQGLQVYHRIFCRELGMLKVKNYHPHITLARLRQNDQVMQKKQIHHLIELPSISFQAENIILYSSLLFREGASYDPLFTIKLGS